jgi:hypothetical protein
VGRRNSRPDSKETLCAAGRWGAPGSVRATLYGADSVTTVVIIGQEVRLDDSGIQLRRLRIDNRAGGNGGKVWKKMVAAAMLLDSAAVPEAARPQ